MVTGQTAKVITLRPDASITSDPFVNEKELQDQTGEVALGESLSVSENKRILQLLDMVGKMSEHSLKILIFSILDKLFGVTARAIDEKDFMPIEIESEPSVNSEKHQMDIERLMLLKRIQPETGEDLIATED